MTNTTVSCVRGCGTRTESGCYLCLGIGPGGTLTVEDLILDPVKIWPGTWQRGFKLLPNKRGWNDVGIFVGESFYASPWDFVEEARRFGISRKVPPTFPFGELTPGKSQMIFFHRKGHPRFDYHIDSEFIEVPLNGCKFFPVYTEWDSVDGKRLENEKLWDKTEAGYHPKIETQTKCSFAHRHLAGRIHNCDFDGCGQFTIEMPSFSYTGIYPLIKPEKGQDDMTWDIAAFMVAPISHVEMPKKLNNPTAHRANKAGYETIVTEW